MPRVVCVGAVLLDRVYGLATIPAAGSKAFARSYHESGGGIAATAAVAVAHLGGAASWCGPVGSDSAGDALLALLGRHGVECGMARRLPGVASPSAAALVDAAGERALVIHRDPGLRLDRCALPADAAAVLADHRHSGAVLDAFAQAHARGLPSVLDADVGEVEGFAGMVRAAGHAVFSGPALAGFTGHDDPADGLRAAQARTSGVVGVTLGEAGSLFLVDGRLHEVAAFRVLARNTTGCGDVFHGAYALALAEGRGVLDAARFASAAAALKAAAGRGWDGMPGRSEVDALERGQG